MFSARLRESVYRSCPQVDDISVNQRVAVAILKRLGVEAAATAADGEEATALACDEGPGAKGPFDMILMDLQMPKCDGLEATRRIRGYEAAHPARQRAFVVALTAHASSDDRDECFANGMDGFVTKPLSPLALLEALKGARPGTANGKS